MVARRDADSEDGIEGSVQVSMTGKEGQNTSLLQKPRASTHLRELVVWNTAIIFHFCLFFLYNHSHYKL